MNDTAVAVIHACAAAAHDGTLPFGEIVGRLTAVGVESYQADYRQRTTRFYLPDGVTVAVPLHAPALAIAEDFDAPAMQEAIRGSQRGEVKYPEFLRRSMSAGCVGYTVWIAGRHVSYFGRRGEVHLERFPGAAA
jgi:uncharacterized protein YbcV (DUF1398 family)